MEQTGFDYEVIFSMKYFMQLVLWNTHRLCDILPTK